MTFKVLVFLAGSLLWACNTPKETSQTQGSTTNSATEGSITVVVDDAIFPIARQEANGFMNEYNKTSVNITVLPEDKAIQCMLRDSVDAVWVSRELNTGEKKEIERQKSVTQVFLQGYNAVAVLVHPNSPDTSLSVAQLKDIFSGKIKNWKELNQNNPNAEISIVIDNANSSVYNYLQSKLEVQDISKLKIYASKSSMGVIESVSKNKNSLGFVGFNWLSGLGSQTDSLRNSVRILAISELKAAAYPSQSSLAEGTYPLRHALYMLVKGRNLGLAYAFATYIGQEVGQRIMLKSGLLPIKIPGREIEIIKK